METVQVNGMAYGQVVDITVTGSPFTFANPENVRVQVAVSAGTVTTIAHSCDGITFNTVGLLGGTYLLNPGQSLKVTYAIAPTMKYWPV
jgi:hypothetical protein